MYYVLDLLLISIGIMLLKDIAILNELWKNREEEIKEKTWKN
jgi:hypothetical protein